jgi:hypothetical protein
MTSDAGALGAPNFDVVLRGYDRKQVDEHVARLQRVMARMRADLEMARSQPIPLVSPPGGMPSTGGQQRPTPRPRPGHAPQQGGTPDVVGSFTDRMQSILQAAEEEAAEIQKALGGDVPLLGWYVGCEIARAGGRMQSHNYTGVLCLLSEDAGEDLP